MSLSPTAVTGDLGAGAGPGGGGEIVEDRTLTYAEVAMSRAFRFGVGIHSIKNPARCVRRSAG
ncbi:hypothetical protein I553_4411 [Mycobacterium xenopi 4042]|uniref:Uncharacterized protein n=1 Tax=Mycobacterium xenopi 4042 TaxID=1299334 RepID=X8AH03_MYCXE|nr:hypothetical protein I553_4411 [Mycobacterium xenopi 4042]